MKIHVASAKIAGRYIFAVLPNSWLCKNSISLKQLKLEFYRSGSFHSASLTLTDLTPAVQMLKWSLPSPQKKTNNGWGWILRSGRGQLRETRSISTAPPAISKFTFPRQHWPKDLSILQRDIHLIKVKYCKDTRPQNQLNKRRAGTAHRLLLHPSRNLHYPPCHAFGVIGTIYNTYTIEPFKHLLGSRFSNSW